MAICHNKKYEREFVKLMVKQGLTCFRIAGSGSAEEAVCDCVLYLPESSLVEVKATKEEIFYMRKKIREQLTLMKTACETNNLLHILAIKFKNRGWNIYRLDSFEKIPLDGIRCSNENLRKDIIPA